MEQNIEERRKKKEKFSHKYFNDTKIKNLKDFKETTPNGNIIEGVICKKANKFLGSMVIEKITLPEKDKVIETEQFIQAMPKIHYYDYHHQLYQEFLIKYPVYEKLDGSCLILFALYDENKEIIEIVPKTRGIPVADKHILDMFNELDHSNIEAFFNNFCEANPTLMFELFGTLNQHNIFYPTVRIDIRLIAATSEGEFLDWFELHWLEQQYDFIQPIEIFSIIHKENFWKIRVKEGIFFYYLFVDCTEEQIIETLSREYPTQYDVIQALKSFITRINKNYLKVHNRLLLEGGVLNAYNQAGEHLMYLKIKSADIEEACKTQNGVPRKFILKEVYKYFDEYGSQAKELYQKDENHYKEYIKNNLLEDFDISVVEMKKTQQRITNVFLDVLESKEPPKGLQDICNDLVEKYPNTEISDLMRLFAQEYPEKKRHARMAYSIFERLV